MTAALRATVTLAVLALLLVVGVTWGFHQAVKPFPKTTAAPICVDTAVDRGDQLRAAQVVVDVLNAGTREGLAGRTMQQLTDQGFAAGQSTNAPPGTQVAAAEIWVPDRSDPAIRMLKSYVGKVPVRVRKDLPYPGLDLVVGDGFGDLRPGRATITLRRSGTVCMPPADADADAG